MNQFHNDFILFTLIISLRHALITWGEKFSPQEVIGIVIGIRLQFHIKWSNFKFSSLKCDNILGEAPTDGRGNIDIKKFAKILTRGEDEEEGAGA
jgi:hypothetical protein